jgi:hypothetical protein
MFSIIKSNAVKSSEGFIFRPWDRFEYRYEENGKILTLGVECNLADGVFKISIYKNTIEGWDMGLGILEPEQKRIMKNIVAAAKFKGHEVEFI